MKRSVALLALLSVAAVVQAAEPSAGDRVSLAATPVTKCPAPLVWDALHGTCLTPDVAFLPDSNACRATVVFDAEDPSQLRLLITPQRCNGNDLEYALEAARARLRWILER